MLKTQVRDMREETEELKITLVEKSEQLQEYRIKVLKQFIYLRVLQSVVHIYKMSGL